MSEKLAQATAAPNSGASNSNDFQPTTQNPQTAPVNLFQQQSGIQNVTNTQELLNEQRNVEISVTAEPAPAPPAAAQVRETPYGFMLLAAALVLGAILLIVHRRMRNNPGYPEVSELKTEDSTEAPAVSEPEPESIQTQSKPVRQTQGKPAAKKKTAKKAKRKRR